MYDIEKSSEIKCLYCYSFTRLGINQTFLCVVHPDALKNDKILFCLCSTEFFVNISHIHFLHLCNCYVTTYII